MALNILSPPEGNDLGVLSWLLADPSWELIPGRERGAGTLNLFWISPGQENRKS